MALKKGICKNFENCTLADNNEIQEVDSSEFRCTECGKELHEIPDLGPRPDPTKLILIIVAAVILIGGGIWAYFGLNKDRPPKVEESVSLSLNKEVISIYVGESDTLKATVYSQPEDANITVFYTSDNENVAHIGNNGIVKAVGQGEASITVIAQMEKGIADTASVYVTINNQPREEPPTSAKKPDVKSQGLDIDWDIPVNVSDDEITTTLNNLIGKHTNIAARVNPILKKYFAKDAVVDKIGVNGSTLVNYHQPIRDYLETICASKYLNRIKVIEVRRNSIGRISYVKIQELHYRDPQANE